MKKLLIVIAFGILLSIMVIYNNYCQDRNCFKLAQLWLNTGVYDHMLSCDQLPDSKEVEKVYKQHISTFQDKCDDQFFVDSIGIGDLKSACRIETSNQYNQYETDYLQCQNKSDFVVRIPVRKERFDFVKTTFGDSINGIPYRIIPRILEGVPRGGTKYTIMSEKTFIELSTLQDEMENYITNVDSKTLEFDREAAERDGYSGLILRFTEEMVGYQNEILQGEHSYYYPLVYIYLDAATRYDKKNNP